MYALISVPGGATEGPIVGTQRETTGDPVPDIAYVDLGPGVESNDEIKAATEGKIGALVGGVWVLIDQPAEAPLTLAEALAAFRGRLAEHRWLVETGGVAHTRGGVTYTLNTDRESSGLLTSTLDSIDRGIAPLPTQWKAQNGLIPLSQYADLVAIAQSVAHHTYKCFTSEFTVDVQGRDMTVQELQDADIPALFSAIYDQLVVTVS